MIEIFRNDVFSRIYTSCILHQLKCCFVFVGCDECGKMVKVYCKKHGELIKVKDRLIPSRAKLTTPHQVTVKTIELRAGGDHGKIF